MDYILIPVLSFGVIGVVLGGVLAFAAKFFAVDADPRIEQVLDKLPGANCGGCGYAGCSACAEAIVKGEAPVNACPGASGGAVTEISAIMGVEPTETVSMKAFINCSGTSDCAVYKFSFDGTKSCDGVNRIAAGDKACVYACLGYGDCVSKCSFGAISIHNGVANINRDKCVGCGVCINTCPKKVISLKPETASVTVKCSSKDKGIEVKNKCSAGCIACRLCEKNCEAGAITVENNLAVIDYDKCTGCGICAEKCPKKIIEKLN